MCGDLDQDERELETQLYARFAVHARARLSESEQSPQAAPQIPARDAATYMETLYCDVLGRCLRDAGAAGDGQRYERLALQPVVLARLAGFLAGHMSLGDDPLRKVMEALMEGYGEAEAADRAQRQDHDHHHGDVSVRNS